MSEQLNFEQMIEESMKNINVKEIIEGTIININKKGEVIIDIGYKADGIIPRNEYSYNEAADPNKELKVGDKITAEVIKMNDGEGNVLLSTKRYKMKEAQEELEEKFKNNEVLEEKITEITDKGFIISKEGYNIFIPISLSGITRGENIKDYKDKVVRFRLIECKFRPRRIIGSIKAILDEEKNKKIDEFWNEAEVGKKYKGKVTSISTYGAFVDLGAVQGLLHISEITWNRNTPPNEILKVGQIIDVIAIDVDKENKRIKLSYAEKGPDPWKSVESKYSINDIFTVKVVKMMPFGAFVELEPGIEGLVHLSQICERKITKPEEELRIGQKVNAKIIDMDLANKRIELSIRELENTSNEYKE